MSTTRGYRERHRRRPNRDRHGRGLRGSLYPSTLPAASTRAERFDALVLAALEPIEARWRTELTELDIAVDDVPDVRAASARRSRRTALLADAGVPLARLVPAGMDRRGMPTKARIVLFRRPLEARARDGADLADLVHHVLVEQVATYLEPGPRRHRGRVACATLRRPGIAVSSDEQHHRGLHQQQHAAQRGRLLDPDLRRADRQRDADQVAPRPHHRHRLTVHSGLPARLLLGGDHQQPAGRAVGHPDRHRGRGRLDRHDARRAQLGRRRARGDRAARLFRGQQGDLAGRGLQAQHRAGRRTSRARRRPGRRPSSASRSPSAAAGATTNSTPAAAACATPCARRPCRAPTARAAASAPCRGSREPGQARAGVHGGEVVVAEPGRAAGDHPGRHAVVRQDQHRAAGHRAARGPACSRAAAPARRPAARPARRSPRPPRAPRPRATPSTGREPRAGAVPGPPLAPAGPARAEQRQQQSPAGHQQPGARPSPAGPARR